ncbi:uncharacterized protein LOC133806696 [Humulus lupulus]|uniref:uncharacterized protein LOC133806696 n=1 Tax=Humulus lupulus TaxID=3486 RepID=UPI002B4047AE|nr:uncharacterized protein LOC133806696 [Humulus lupulus]
MKNQNTSTQSEEQSNVNVQSNSHVHSTQSVKNHTFGSKCKILDWIGSGEIIAEGYFISSDPKDEVHHVPLGPSAMKVGIDLVRKNDAFLMVTTLLGKFIEFLSSHTSKLQKNDEMSSYTSSASYKVGLMSLKPFL